MLEEQKLNNVIKGGLEFSVYNQSEKVIETIKMMGNCLDQNFDILKSMLVVKEKESINRENKEICTNCFNTYGYTCCIGNSCELLMEDIKEEYRNEEGIKKLLNTGLVVIDKWEENEEYEETYFLRFKNVYDGDRKVNFTWGGTCIFLGKDGCQFSYEERPCISRQMEPNKELNKCLNGESTKLKSAKSFHSLQDELETIVYEIDLGVD